MLILQMRSDGVNNPVKKIVEKDLVLKKYIKIESVKREESEINAKEEPVTKLRRLGYFWLHKLVKNTFSKYNINLQVCY